MRLFDAARVLDYLAKQGMFVFRTRDLALAFDEPRDGGSPLSRTIGTLCKEGVLERVARGTYVCHSPIDPPVDLIHDVARALRHRDVVVESLESGASTRNMTTQIYAGALTCVTTGKSGRYAFSGGIIILEHSNLPGYRLLEGTTRMPGRRLALASRDAILRDMRLYCDDLGILDNIDDEGDQ